MPDLTAVEDAMCDQCQRYCRTLWSTAVTVGTVVLFVVRCQRCCGEAGAVVVEARADDVEL